LGLELRSKQEKHLAMRISMARFPFQKTLEGFEWKFQPSIDPKVIKELATGRFLADGENVLLLGPPGVGKTHLAVALGLKACELGAWGDVFGDPVIASAILDRLLHHATTINIKGESYRLKERRRAGLLTTPRADLPAVSKGERLSLADAERK